MTGNEDLHHDVRECIVSHILLEHVSMKRVLPAYTDVQKYINDANMFAFGSWGTEVEIYATAHLLQTDIYIYTLYGLNWKWLKFSATTIEPSISINQEVIYLQHTGLNHYDSRPSS